MCPAQGMQWVSKIDTVPATMELEVCWLEWLPTIFD